ncbi:MAG: WYL domain-containing transcriptional regulator [Chloroflexota bacterium]|nr:WYL domain-containing transcriptional regulator [Chloroflexota bacterium]
MPPHSVDDTRARTERVYLLLRRNPDGLTQSEIAERLNIENRSVYNYLIKLEAESRVYKDGKHWLAEGIDPATIRPLEVEAEEAAALYLAARLLVKQSDRRNEIAETLLLKLSHVLKTDVGVGDYIEDAARELAQRPYNPDYVDIFRVVTRAYLYRRKLYITYLPYRTRAFETTFSPYLIEPSIMGASTYVIGYSDVAGALRTFKLERIQSAQLTREEFSVPTDFPGLELLRNAWSIYYGEETVQVALRFQPEVARRVQETRWHPSQQIEADTTTPGGLILRVEVADTTDLIPWIRTWGANCEVLAPADLRDRMMGEVRWLALRYGWSLTTDQSNPHSRFDDIFGI